MTDIEADPSSQTIDADVDSSLVISPLIPAESLGVGSSNGTGIRNPIEDLVDEVVLLVINDEAEDITKDPEGNVTGAMRAALGLTYFKWERARRLTENRGWLRFVPIRPGSYRIGEVVLGEKALAEAALQGELSPTLVAALEERGTDQAAGQTESAQAADPTDTEPVFNQPEATVEERLSEEAEPAAAREVIEDSATDTDTSESQEESELTPGPEEPAAVEDETLAEDEDEETEDDEEDEESTDSDEAQSIVGKGLTHHLSSARAQRADPLSQEKRSRTPRERGNLSLRFNVRLHNQTFAELIHAAKFDGLKDSDKLLLSVLLTRSEQFASIYTTKEKVHGNVLRMVNRGKEKGKRGKKGYLTQEGLEKLIDEVAADGLIAKDTEDMPIVTEKGMDYLMAKRKSKKW